MRARETGATCPDCGTDLASDPALGGLCPQCLLSLGLLAPPPAAGTDERETLEKPSREAAIPLSSASTPAHSPVSPGDREGLRLSPGQVLNERYWIQRLLGRGGMGEVWHALDLKLRVDVALKSLRSERLESEEGRELLRQEVRTAREVVSPNVCRVFDLVEVEGQELLSMEHIDGQTLISLLKERGPLPVPEAGEIASQFLVGLEAVHEAGLVHRDFKPENVMITRSGRVVVMDFGIALKTQDADGRVAGTPAYMAPEQRRGETLDARTDVYAAGVTLAEMVSGEGIQERTSRESLWEGIHADPPRVPEGPWARVIRKAVSPDAGDRYATARDLIRALEVITLRVEGAEETHPYPGLASFTEAESRHFFGREAEVEEMLRKLRRAPLLGVIGPSGAGKSSFLRAGVIPALPEGWGSVYCQPGKAPFASLAQALVSRRPDEAEALGTVAAFEDLDAAVSAVRQWREGYEEGVILADQFEELFTLSAPETQARFAELLGRLVGEANVRVLLSMRDDFLLRCHAHPPLAPVFSELTPLGPPTGASLHRALVQPALSLGYRFEDEGLVREMLEEVSRERGALPLLAFAAAGLWERRDREEGVLAREAYASIGGVAGALAQHAEETLKTIGQDREPVVRELFRNLVTAQGTRAVRDREELLSVFEDREAAGEVLQELVSARLLTSFEVTEPGKEGGERREVQRVEVIHESLLRAWPRLVRWQTQDADGAQLRDELRQAAQVWQDRGRPDELLWSGQLYKDFSLWRGRYPGGLTAVEEAFAGSMEGHAIRRRRRTRMATAALVGAAAAVAIVTSVLWQRSEAEARRAEAARLLALGQLEIEDDPTAALAYARKSLETADSEQGRLFALRALQRGPIAFVLPANQGDGLQAHTVAFSPDGEWLALGGLRRAQLWGRGGGTPLFLDEYAGAASGRVHVAFGPESDVLVTDHQGDLRFWSVPDGTQRRRVTLEGGPPVMALTRGGLFYVRTVGSQELVHRIPFDGSPPRRIGSTEALRATALDAAGAHAVYARGPRIYRRSLASWAGGPQLLGESSAEVLDIAVHPDGERLAASDASGTIGIWALNGRSARPRRRFAASQTPLVRFDPQGRWLVGLGDPGRPTARLWDLEGPAAAEPLLLTRKTLFMMGGVIDPSGRWLVTTHSNEASLWPLTGAFGRVIAKHEARVSSVAFTPDGTALLSAAGDDTVRLWRLSPGADPAGNILVRTAMSFYPTVHSNARSEHVLVHAHRRRVMMVPLEGGMVRDVSFPPSSPPILAAALSPDGRLVAMAHHGVPAADKVIRLVDLETGAERSTIPLPGAGDGEAGASSLQFVDRGRLVATMFEPSSLVLFDLQDRTARVLAAGPNMQAEVSHNRRFVVGIAQTGRTQLEGETGLVHVQMESGALRALPAHGNQVSAVALDPSDELVATGSADGVVRVGAVTGEEPRLLLGHEALVRSVAFSPDGRWLAAGSEDGTIRLWPVPDVSRPPFHTLPHAEVLARLRSATNLEVVPDTDASNGYRLHAGPFPGWANPPEW